MASKTLSPSAIQRDAIPLNATPLAIGHGGDSGALGRTEHELYVLRQQTPNLHSDYRALTTYNAKLSEGEHIKKLMGERVRAKLVRLDAVAIGFREGAEPGSEREVIPAEFWTFADIDFMNDTARYRDRRYTSILVAVCLPRHFVALPDDTPVIEAPLPVETPPVINAPPAKMGAPSLAAHRLRAIEAAAGRDPEFFTRPYHEAILRVQEILDETRPGWRRERGFNHKSFEADFRKLRSNK